MIQYINGNSTVELFEDGTRVIKYEDTLQLDYPLNIDIRVTTQCAFGYNPETGVAFCTFCHESATTNGKECDYKELQNKLIGLPKGIELAIGANQITVNLCHFLTWCKRRGYIVNLTINQGHIKRDETTLNSLIRNNLIKGLGVSYRSELNWRVPKSILDYEHTVVHVIAGIDTVDDVLLLKNKGVRKVLVLGEKNFGFNKGKVDLTTKTHKQWKWWICKLFNTFDVVSFDNLALEQLNMKRFFNDDNWNVFNQGEYSFFVDSVKGFYHPSSRSYDKVDWNNISMKDFFQQYINKH